MSYLATSKPHRSQPGFILLAVMAIVSALLLLGTYFMQESVSEIRIARSEAVANRAYYLAEAGGNEAVYRLKQSSLWETQFLNGTLNNTTFNRSGVFDANGGYTVTATSLAPALVDVTVTGTYLTGATKAQRVVKIRLARATNSSTTWSQSMFGGGQGGQLNGNITVSSDCTVNGGTLQANQDFKITKATLTVNNAVVQSSNNIITNAGGQLVLNHSTQQTGVPSIAMPQVDFDSSLGTSLKNRANQTYTSTQFQNLPDGTTLNGVTYVTGAANWTDKTLTINGILAAADTITISLNGNKTLTINTGATGSGILGKNDIAITLKNGASFTVDGLLYASRDLSYSQYSNSTFTVNGGEIGFHMETGGDSTGTCAITYNSDYASQPLDPVYNGGQSPIIEVNHWEEEY